MPDSFPPTCRHAEFLAEVNTGRQDWQLRSYAGAVRVGFGRRGTLKYFAAHAMTLLPMLLFSVRAVYGSQYALLVWSALALLGYLAGSPGPTGIGMLWHILLAVVGFVFSVMKPDTGHFFGGLLPGFSWFACCAVYGTTEQYLLDRLRASPEYFETLCNAGILVPPAPLQKIDDAGKS